jgi:hypothetical protein
MKRGPAYETLHMLLEEHVFSSEELDLIQRRINEELEFDSSTMIQIWEKQSGKHHNADSNRI